MASALERSGGGASSDSPTTGEDEAIEVRGWRDQLARHPGEWADPKDGGSEAWRRPSASPDEVAPGPVSSEQPANSLVEGAAEAVGAPRLAPEDDVREPSDTAAPDVQPGEAGETGESELGSDRSNPGRQAVTVTWPFLGDHSAGKVHFANPPADTWTNVVGEVDDEVVDVRRIRHEYGDQSVEPPDPTGEELLEMDEEERSLIERGERAIYEKLDDVLETVQEHGNQIEEAYLGRPKPTSTGARIDAPTVQDPREGIHTGDWLTGLVAGGILVYATCKAAWEHSRRREER